MEKTYYLSKHNSVAFTGHRFVSEYKLSELISNLRSTIIEHYNAGFRVFITGMAIGFDTIAAEELICLRLEELPNIYIKAVVPFKGQEERWSLKHQNDYKRILEEVDEVIVLSDHFYKGCEKDRNTFMLNHSSRVIAYFDGIPRGGTYDTILKAEKKGMKITNIF